MSDETEHSEALRRLNGVKVEMTSSDMNQLDTFQDRQRTLFDGLCLEDKAALAMMKIEELQVLVSALVVLVREAKEVEHG